MKDVYLVTKACPVCGRELRGNNELKFFCKDCNMLFERRHFEITPEEKKEEKKVKSPVKKPVNVSPVEIESPPEETAPETSKISPDNYGLESEQTIIASEKSSKIHQGQCHFVKKIHKENRIYLSTVEEGKQRGYALCVCLRRKGAK